MTHEHPFRERTNLERLKRNLYIDRSDPLYLQKKVRYLGQDFDALFQMAELREREGRPEKALELYRRAERAATSSTQFSRAVHRRRQLERSLQPPGPTLQPVSALRPVPLLQSATTLHPAQTASAVAPARSTVGNGGSSRALIGLMGLLLGLLVGLLGAFWLVQYRLDVHFYHHSGPADRQPAQPGALRPGVWEEADQASLGLTYLRSAILGYYRLEGKFPDSLDELTGPFPSNYISAIPPDPVYGKRQVVDRWDGTGGWVYQKPPGGMVNEGTSTGGTKEGISLFVDPLVAVTQALQPNWKVGENGSFSGEFHRFEPIRLLIFPDERRVELASGDLTLLAADAAVGLPQSPTPEGDFFVRRRVWLPQGNVPERQTGRQTVRQSVQPSAMKPLFTVPSTVSSPYGVAGLEFAEGYAIHGTNSPETIGQAATLGCVRLDNETMRRFFAWTPLGTEVVIRVGKEKEAPSIEEKAPSLVAVSGSHSMQTHADQFHALQSHVQAAQSYEAQSRTAQSHAPQSYAADRAEFLASPLQHLTPTALEAIQPRADERDLTGVYRWKG